MMVHKSIHLGICKRFATSSEQVSGYSELINVGKYKIKVIHSYSEIENQ